MCVTLNLPLSGVNLRHAAPWSLEVCVCDFEFDLLAKFCGVRLEIWVWCVCVNLNLKFCGAESAWVCLEVVLGVAW